MTLLMIKQKIVELINEIRPSCISAIAAVENEALTGDTLDLNANDLVYLLDKIETQFAIKLSEDAIVRAFVCIDSIAKEVLMAI